MKLSLISPSNSCLWTPAAPVTDIDSQVKPFISDMRALMETHKGIGLAAPQIGLSFAFFVWLSPDSFAVVINPSIVERSGWNSSQLEGCLSFPGRQTYVPRNTIIRAVWTDEVGAAHDEVLTMQWARTFQHEYQHLMGEAIFPKP